MVCMDLIGPIGAEVSGGKAGAKPRHILVITDPYGHMVWLETITAKSAEGVYVFEARRGDNSWLASRVFIYSRPVRDMPGA